MSGTENNAPVETESAKQEELGGGGDEIKKQATPEAPKEESKMEVDGGGDKPTGNGDVEKESGDEKEDEDEEMKDEEESEGEDEEEEEDKEEEVKKEEKVEKEEKKEEKKETKVEKSPKKVVKKKEEKSTPRKKDDDDDDEEEEEEEEEVAEHKLGLLEQPVVLSEGRKREKKKVERLEFTVKESPKEKVVGEGSGEKLGDMPRVEFQIGRNRADDLKPLHRLLFNRNGTANEVKRNIRKFNGFTFKANSAEYDRKTQNLSKNHMSQLKFFAEALDLERSGTKEALVERLMEFLMKPKSSGKPLPKPKRRSSSTKRTSSGKKKKGASKKKKETTKKKTKGKGKSKEEVEEASSDEEEEDEEENEEEEEDSDEKSDSDAESEEEEAPKKKKRKVEPKKAAKTPAKKETKKTEKKAEKKPPPKKAESDSDSDDDSSDDEPLVAKKKEPTNDEIKELVKKILDGANLEEVTMKTVCKQVYDKYPDHDLTSKKDFIKATVKQIIR